MLINHSIVVAWSLHVHCRYRTGERVLKLWGDGRPNYLSNTVLIVKTPRYTANTLNYTFQWTWDLPQCRDWSMSPRKDALSTETERRE